MDSGLLKVDRRARDRELRAEKYILKPDHKIKDAVDKAILYDPRVLSTQVNTRVDNGLVTLTGKVHTLSAKQAAAQNSPEGSAVVVDNEVTISGVKPEPASHRIITLSGLVMQPVPFSGQGVKQTIK